MISADVEANKNKKNKKKIWWLYLTNFYKNQLQNLKYNVKKVCTYHLILVGILSILMLTDKNSTGGGFFWLNEQNLLSVAKVICRQSLNHIAINNDVDNILFDSWPLPRNCLHQFFSFMYLRALCFMLNIDRALKTIFTAHLMQTCTEF